MFLKVKVVENTKNQYNIDERVEFLNACKESIKK